MLNKDYFKYQVKLYFLTLLGFLILRIGFILYHFKEIIPFSFFEIIETFLVGALFDSVVISSLIVLITILQFIIYLLTKKSSNKTFFIISNIVIGIFLFINIIDIFYFEQYGTRINSLVSEVKNDSNILIVTIWKMFPVVWTIIIFAIFQFIFYKFHKIIYSKHINKNLICIPQIKWSIFSVLLFLGLSFLYYGPPLWTISEFSSSSVLNQASMNGVYCLCKSYQQNIIYNKDIPSYHFYSNQKALSVLHENIINENDSLIRTDFPSLRYMKPHDSTLFNKKDIVIILMESFGSKNIGCLNNGKGLSPSFDSLAKQGIIFTRFKANGPRTQNGLISTISGFPAILGTNLQRRKGLNEFQTIGNILLTNGYKTNFIHNGYASYDDIDKFMKQGGFVNQIDVNNFEKWRIKTEWGVSDQDLFDKAYDLIWDSEKPTLSVLLTMSNHPPFEIPKEFKISHTEINKMTAQQAAFYYSDFALGEFIFRCMKNPRYNNTLFYILADHSENYESSDGEINIFDIPLLILNSENNIGISTKVASQCDIPSTILSELNYSGKYHFIGQNILDGHFQSFAFMRNYTNDIYYSEDNYILKYNLETFNSKLFIRNGNNIDMLNGKIYYDTKNRMNKFTECYIQSISLIFRNGKYRFDI